MHTIDHFSVSVTYIVLFLNMPNTHTHSTYISIILSFQTALLFTNIEKHMTICELISINIGNVQFSIHVLMNTIK